MATKLAPTRTTGPLHFEDLEPHRFEDLVRRLIYDFRTWRQLELTGRSGSDAGFDARGFEVISGAAAPADNEEDEAAAAEDLPDRVWLIQCKREKFITPKKLGQYLDTLPTDEAVKLYGIVFAAACDFSKAARDLFRTTTQDMGFAEAYLWGKGELEDMLYQPKNDDVLFTFFGVSKRIRRRSLSDQVRRRLTMKRKAQRVLEGHDEVLVRDAGDERYPYPDENQTDRVRARRWGIYRFENCRHDGLHVLWRRYLAFIDDDGVAWDYAEGMDDATPHNNPWRIEEDMELIRKHDEARAEGMAVWNALPERNRAWLQVWKVLPYEDVIDIDEKGDDWFEGPHIYVADFDLKRGPFRRYTHVKLATADQWSSREAQANPKTRVAKFARMPNPSA